MSRIAELDSLDLGWLALFLIPAAGVDTLLMLVLAGNKVVSGGLLVAVLLAIAWLLVTGLSKWQGWWRRLGLTLAVTGMWLLMTGSIVSFFGKGFC